MCLGLTKQKRGQWHSLENRGIVLSRGFWSRLLSWTRTGYSAADARLIAAAHLATEESNFKVSDTPPAGAWYSTHIFNDWWYGNRVFKDCWYVTADIMPGHNADSKLIVVCKQTGQVLLQTELTDKG